MILDLKKYAVNKRFIQDFYRQNKDNNESIGKSIAICSSAIHCPSLALCFYLAEDIGYVPDLIKVIETLISFYGYTQILGQQKDSPYFEKYDISNKGE